MGDPRIAFRKELAKTPWKEMLRRYAKGAGLLLPEVRAKYGDESRYRPLITDLLVYQSQRSSK